MVDVRGDVLRPPHGTTPATMKSNKNRKYVLAPADKVATNLVVVWRLYYINTFKKELSGTKTYKETSEKEKSVVNGHCNYLALKFSVCVE